MLLVHGELDFIPVDGVIARARVLFTGPSQRLVTIPRASHATLFAPTSEGRSCTGALYRQFLADPSAALDTGCRDDIQPIDFETLPTGYPVAMFGTSDFWDG